MVTPGTAVWDWPPNSKSATSTGISAGPSRRRILPFMPLLSLVEGQVDRVELGPSPLRTKARQDCTAGSRFCQMVLSASGPGVGFTTFRLSCSMRRGHGGAKYETVQTAYA